MALIRSLVLWTYHISLLEHMHSFNSHSSIGGVLFEGAFY